MRGWSWFIIAAGEQLQFCIQPQGGFSICTRSSIGWMPCHSVAEVLPAIGRLGSTPAGTNRHPPVPQIVNVALDCRDHDVLRHQLTMCERLFHLGEITCGHHLVALIGQADLVGIGDGHRVGFAILAGHNRTVMRKRQGDLPRLTLSAFFTRIVLCAR